MKFFEMDGAVFRGENFPAEILVGNEWKPYKGDKARVMMFGNEISEDEAGAADPAPAPEANEKNPA